MAHNVTTPSNRSAKGQNELSFALKSFLMIFRSFVCLGKNFWPETIIKAIVWRTVNSNSVVLNQCVATHKCAVKFF